MCTKAELNDLIKTVWNPGCRDVDFAKPVEGSAFIDVLWEALLSVPVSIVRQAMKAELLNPDRRPSIRKVPSRCADQMRYAPKPETADRSQYERAGFWQFDLSGDFSAWARHARTEPGAFSDDVYEDQEEYFRRAIELLEAGECNTATTAGGVVCDPRRLIPVYRLHLSMLDERRQETRDGKNPFVGWDGTKFYYRPWGRGSVSAFRRGSPGPMVAIRGGMGE